MKFVDEATIHVKAGNGGNGCLSFRREKFIPYGGPDGGNGGKGGDIYVRADAALNTLSLFRHKRRFEAGNGDGGKGRLKTGHQGDDCVILVPIGTQVFDANTQELLGDLLQDGQEMRVAQGGAPGLGNTVFKSSVQRAPRQFTYGKPGEERHLLLSLHLLADVGLLGMPNAGKSSIIRALSNAKPKVADYPFTTLTPVLGVVTVDSERQYVMADIPGIIEGAASGAGLGLHFLKHLARTKLLLHMLDCDPPGGAGVLSVLEHYHQIEHELSVYREEHSLQFKPEDIWVVLTKMDRKTPQELEAFVHAFQKQVPDRKLFTVSILQAESLATLSQAIIEHLSHDSHEVQLSSETLY